MTDVEAGQAWHFDKPRHVKYWKRCLKTYLPSQYTSNDSNRMYLAYLIISALEALDVIDECMTGEERSGYTDWIYRCQHPNGGFRMWPGTDLDERANEDNARWDPAHVPATYFALTSLLTLGDDLHKVKHGETMQWLSSMQRVDGSFGETRVDGQLEGGNDPRFGYCAAGSRLILQSISNGATQDLDLDKLASSICQAQSYDGGIADAAFREPHAGYTFCGLGALALTKRSQNNSQLNLGAITRWLVYRQTDLVDPDAMLDSEFIGKATARGHPSAAVLSGDEIAAVSHVGSTNAAPVAAGMNGRTNKVADTCYCWWVSASLEMLGKGNLYNKPALRQYLLQLTQNTSMGGFSKFPNDTYADIYHSFMGLIALSLCSTDEERCKDGIKEWDAEMCISKDVRRRITEYPK